jgi:hypothetical protein
MKTRRDFFRKAAALSAGLLLRDMIIGCTSARSPTILIVSGWQDVNIGDIAHTPGLLHILETFLPRSKIILWKSSSSKQVHELLQLNFPSVRIIYGGVNSQENEDNQEVTDAVNQADIMLHGSGPFLVGAGNLDFWIRESGGKPFGVFGTTLESPREYHLGILRKASFVFTRETLSIEHLKKAGIEGDHIRFAPDATFFMHIRDDRKAGRFLKENGLEERKFICVIPRLRITPYYKFRPGNAGWSDERIAFVEELNQRTKEQDHAKMREAMVAWVRETGNKVLVCPEMTYQVDIMDELLIDPLPADVRPYVIKRGYWMPDEAASVYEKTHTVLSFECHSPIIAAAIGTPFFYLRQPEDTIKGQMYYDLGFDDWTFEIEQTKGEKIAGSLREVWTDYPKARARVRANMDKVGKIYSDRVKMIRSLTG